MKKRLISLLVALCMAVTLLPVSAITAWAEESGQLKIVQGGYPNGSNSGSQSCSGTDWSYDKDTQTLTLSPSTPTNYDFSNNGIHTGMGNNTDCNIIIGQHATVTDGYFRGVITNHGKIIGGRFDSSVTNESDGIIENGQFGIDFSPCTVTNNGGTINGGTFKDELTGSGIEPGYTLKANIPTGFQEVLVNKYRNSCYVIPNQTYPASVRIVYNFDYISGFPSLPPLDVVINSAQHMLLSDWCGSDLKIEYDGIGGRAYEVTFTAPPANGSTVTISPLTRLVIDKDGYPAKAQDWNGNRVSYTGDGWKFENNSLILEPTAEKSYDFNSTDLNPHRVAVNCPVTVNSNATITNGIFLKEVTGSALNGVFLNVPTGCENSAKKITVSDNGKITALKMSGEATALDSAANELYVVGQPTGTLYVTLSSGKVREVQLPLTADLELQLNDPKPEPKPEPKPDPEPEASTYTLTVKGGTFTYNGSEAMTSASVPVDAEVKVTLNQSAVPEGMVFDLWAMDEASLLGNPAVAYNEESFTIPAGSVAKGSTVTVEAQYRDATIESEPSILGTAAIIGVAGAGTAVIVWQGYRIGMELYEKYFQPTPEETAAEQPAPEAPAAAAS